MAVARANLPDVQRVLVGYSGGKDSLATIDLCLRAGKQVEAFFMFFLPGMDYTDYWCSYAERRFQIPIHRVQHWNTSYYLRRGVFCEPQAHVPAIGHNDVEAAVRERTGLEWVGYGYKLRDSPSRRSYMTFMSKWPDGICEKLKRFSPLMDWTDREVLAYLSRRRILIPEMSSRRVNGVDLRPNTLAQFREEWPDDYRRILKVFPYAEAQSHRTETVERLKRAEKNLTPAV